MNESIPAGETSFPEQGTLRYLDSVLPSTTMTDATKS